MAGAGVSLNFLDEGEFSSLSGEAKQKLHNLFSEQYAEIERLKSELERIRVNAEQQYFEIDKQLIESNRKLETETQSNENLKEKVSQLESLLQTSERQRNELQITENGAAAIQLQLNKANEQLESDKRDLTVLIEKKNKEIERLHEEWKSLSEKVIVANREKCEAQAKFGEIQSTVVTLEFQNKRLEQEKQALQEQLDLLDRQLNDKTNELLLIRKEQSSSLLETQSQLEDKVEENGHLLESIENLRNTNAQQTAKIESLIQKVADSQTSQRQAEDQFLQELRVKSRLADLYKKSLEESEAQTEKLTGAVVELRKMLEQSSLANEELSQALKEESSKHVQEIQEKEEIIEKQKLELANANDLLRQAKKSFSEEQLETMFPTASATSKLLQSRSSTPLKSNMTLTQIYTEYKLVSEELIEEKAETARLNQALNEILHEIEEKAPLMRRQREEYVQALENIDQLSGQLESSMTECENLRLEADDIKRKYNHMQRENQKLQQQSVDLSRQVQYLVKEIEEIRGGRVVREEEPMEREISNSSQVISERLIRFRNIEELQDQNQRMIAIIRELSEKREEEEEANTQNKTKELREQLDMASNEILELKSSRDKQLIMVREIAQQRDMYKVLLQQETSNASLAVPETGHSTVTPTKLPMPSSPLNKMLEEKTNALQQMQEDFNLHKKEKAENERLLNEQLDAFRQEKSDLRIQNTKLASRLEFSEEKYKVLQTNCDNYKKEIQSLRDKNQKHSTNIAKYEQTVNTLRQDLLSTQANLARAEAQAQNLRMEKELLRNTEQRLMQEIERMRQEKQSQGLLMANLQAIQNNLERSEFEMKSHYSNKIESLELEVNSLRRKLNAETDEHRSISQIWEKQNKDVRSQLQTSLESHEADKERIKTLQKQLLEAKQQISEYEAKMKIPDTAAKAQVTPLKTPAKSTESQSEDLLKTIEELKEAKAELSRKNIELSNSKTMLNRSVEHAEQYKAMAENLQQVMTEQSQANLMYENRMEEMAVAKTKALQQIDSLEKERQELLQEKLKLSEECHTSKGELRKQLNQLQTELQEALEQKEEAQAREQHALQESQNQIRIASEVQDKYQRELILHAADVEALTVMKKQAEGFTERLTESERKRMKAEEQFGEAQTSWKEQEQLLRKEIESLETRCREISNQNKLLHDQMEKMSQDVIAVQQAVTRRESLTLAADDSSRSSEQLLEVVKFLRKEKEIAETKLEVVQAESNNIKQRLSRAQAQIEDLNNTIREERENSQSNLQTAAQHSELMRKVENLNLLTDSNRLLRDEKEKLEQTVHTLEAKLKKTEEEIEPIQATLRDTQAQLDALSIERDALKGEVDRWKSRTNRLIEQANKTDPEEIKKLTQEKDMLKKEIARLSEENQRHRAEISKLNSSQTTLQAEINKLNASQASLQQELNDAKEEAMKAREEVAEQKDLVEKKEKLLEENTKTINQLKRIGRKYKEQAETVQKEMEELKKLHESEQKERQQSAEVLEKAASEAVEKATAPLQQKTGELEKTNEELSQNVKDLNTKFAASQEECQKLQKEISSKDEELSKLSSEFSDNEKRLNQSKNVLQAARKKISTQNEQVEKLNREIHELKQKVISEDSSSTTAEMELRLRAVQSQYDDKVSALETKVTELTSANESVISERQALEKQHHEQISELQNKIQALQKQIESQAQPQTSRPTATATVERNSAPSAEPKMANIRPLASPASVRAPQTQAIQPQSAATKATASIRPMAISSTSNTHPSSTASTPMAAVMPTTVSVPEVQVSESSQTSQMSPVTTSRPSQNVQIVTPQAGTADNIDNGDITTSEQINMEPSTSVEVSQEVTSVDAPSSSAQEGAEAQSSGHGEAGEVEPQQSVTSSREGKRTREDFEENDEKEPKRSKMAAEPVPSITVTDEHANTVALQSEAIQSSYDGDEDSAQMVEEPYEGYDEYSEEPENMCQDNAVIVLESDEDDDEDGGNYEEDEDGNYIDGDEEYEEDEEEDDDEEDEGAEDSNPEEEFHETEESQGELQDVSTYEDASEDIQSQDLGKDDDVVILDDDEEMESAGPSGERQETTSTSLTSGGSTITQHPSITRSMPTFTTIERQMSVPRAGSQLTPFVLGNTGGFEDGEDCIVPSTPTLFVPNRADGFAEAISSPQIPLQRFTFTPSADNTGNQQDFAQLGAQNTLGMDNTQVDLSQLEEGTGRSVPSTPSNIPSPVPIEGESGEPPVASQSVSSTTTTASSSADSMTTHLQESTEAESKGSMEDVEIIGDSAEAAARGEESLGDREDAGERTEEGEASTSTGASKDDSMPSSSQQQDGGARAKKIQPIVWKDTSPSSQPRPVQEGQPIHSVVSQSSGGFRGHAIPTHRGAMRGAQQSRGGRGYHPQMRGNARRPQRGGMRGNVYRRPPMY